MARRCLPNPCVMLFLLGMIALSAYFHFGSGIFVDGQECVFFVDTGGGVWRLDPPGNLTLIHRHAYHWMAFDKNGSFANSQALGKFDGGSFELATPPGAVPALIISSDFPVAVGNDGGLYYVPYKESGARELIRRMPDGSRSVFAVLPADTGPEAMRWVNGIALASDGALYVTDNDAIRRIARDGAVSTIRKGIRADDCSDPPPETPKLPYLRGLAVAQDGTIYAAATGCRSVIAILPSGSPKTVAKAETPWSPTGVALSGRDLYILEYLHTPGGDRRIWIPRVRKVAADGTVTTLATVERARSRQNH